jgi:predicted PurR-regulated permease PerM
VIWVSRGAILLVSLVALLGFWQLVMPIGVGFVLAFLLLPAVDILERWGLARLWSTSIVLGVTGLLFVLLMMLIGPQVVDQIQGILAQQETILGQLENWVMAWASQLGRWIPDQTWIEAKVALFAQLKKWGLAFSTALPGYVLTFMGWMGNLLLAPLFAFFFLWEGRNYLRFVFRIVPIGFLELSVEWTAAAARVLGSYLRGQALDCLGVGLLLWVALAAAGLPGAFTVALISGLMNAIPYLGPILGVGLASLFWLATPGLELAWWWIPVIFFLVNQVDGYLVYPMTVGRSLSLDAFPVMIALLLGGLWGGILGMLLAAPLLALSIETLKIINYRGLWFESFRRQRALKHN